MRQIRDYQETQRLAPWVFVLMGAFTILGLIGIYVQIVLGRPVGDHPMSNGMMIVFVAIFGFGLPLFLTSMKLEIKTEFEGVRVRYWPFVNRLIPYAEIESAIGKSYSPLLEYGGWGIRGMGKRIAYNARGSRGVLVTLKSGATVMLGTQNPSELEAAIRSGMRD